MAKNTVAQRKTATKRAPAKAKILSADTIPSAKPDVSAETDVAQKIETNGETPREATEKPKKKSLYPEGTKLFSYQPKGDGQIIQFPLEFEYPDKVWLWRLNKQPFLAQTWAWMTRAKVPDEIQLAAQRLPDDEYPELFKAWFAAMGGGATPGE